MKDAAIGVFDSGVGGLSVLREIRLALPHEDLFYVADSGVAPYGERSEEFILDRVQLIFQFFMQRGVKAVVIACNTATAVGVNVLRQQSAIPIVAMEPAVKPATQLTQTGIIGVLATSRTLASVSFARLANNYRDDGIEFILQPCPGFVEQVEAGDLTGRKTCDLVERYVSPLPEQGADTLVLGCTHYPFLAPVIRSVAGPSVHVIDSGGAVARQVRRRIEAEGLLSVRDRRGTEQFWTSGALLKVEPVISKLWGRAVTVRSMTSAKKRVNRG